MATLVCDIGMNSRLTPEDRERFQSAKAIQEILATARTVAIVGMSTELTKASNMVGSYLMDEGFTVIPVNPRATEILGQRCYPDLKSIPVPVDVVDVFRPAKEVAAIVDEAIAIGAKAVWTQLRIADLQAAARAQAGLVAIADKCIKMEHGRFGGQLHWAGMNTGIVTAQRRKAVIELPDPDTLAWVEEAVGPFRVLSRFAHDHAYSQLWRLSTKAASSGSRCTPTPASGRARSTP